MPAEFPQRCWWMNLGNFDILYTYGAWSSLDLHTLQKVKSHAPTRVNTLDTWIGIYFWKTSSNKAPNICNELCLDSLVQGGSRGQRRTWARRHRNILCQLWQKGQLGHLQMFTSRSQGLRPLSTFQAQFAQGGWNWAIHHACSVIFHRGSGQNVKTINLEATGSVSSWKQIEKVNLWQTGLLRLGHQDSDCSILRSIKWESAWHVTCKGARPKAASAFAGSQYSIDLDSTRTTLRKHLMGELLSLQGLELTNCHPRATCKRLTKHRIIQTRSVQI